jgi:uncharacterized OB-fold protein
MTSSSVGNDLRPRPEPDESSAPFWDGAAVGRLVLQRCASCTRYQYPPDVVCVHCQSPDIEFTTMSGRGTLYSYAIVDRAFHAGFVEALPYVVALVELDEQAGLKLLTNIVEAEPSTLQIGMPLEVVFEARGDVVIPQFRPVGGSS